MIDIALYAWLDKDYSSPGMDMVPRLNSVALFVAQNTQI